nr:ribonuclease T2-like [Lytechinus pictus]
MARFSLLLLLVAVSYLDVGEGISFQELFRQVWEESPYDKLILEYQWAPSYCKKEECRINRLAKKEWTIKSLWAYKNIDENHENKLINCEGPEFNNDDINDIRPQLIKKWPTYKRGENNLKYWKKNYEKYGKCVNDLEKFNTMKKYFKNTIELSDKYKIKEILHNGDNPVNPSVTPKYMYNDFKSAIKKYINKDPNIKCYEKENKQYIYEIDLCFNKKLEAINCDISEKIDDDYKCDIENKIEYPKFPHFHLGA